MSHLGLDDWVRFEWGDELDLVGPFARQILTRWGAVYPNNAHFGLPVLAEASGGTMLTGLGGDEVLTLASRLSLLRPVFRPGRAGARAAAELTLSMLPRRVQRRLPVDEVSVPWMTSAANGELKRRLAAHDLETPLRWSSAVRHVLWRSRYLQATLTTLRALAELFEVGIAHPFVDPGFLSAVAASHPWSGFPSREAGMRELFTHLLPSGVLSRSTKASFTTAFFGAYSRAFAARWDGSGIDGDLVDIDGLRRTWEADPVDARSYNLLQGVWVASHADGGKAAVS